MIGLFSIIANEAAAPQQGGIFGMFMPLIIIFVIFYFLLIRPQQKQQKKTKQMLEALKKGDEVITRGGMIGKIAGIADSILTLQLADNVKIKITRDAITSVTPNTVEAK